MSLSNSERVKHLEKSIRNNKRDTDILAIKIRNVGIETKKLEIEIRNLEIRLDNYEIRMSEYPFSFIKERMVNVALGILYHNNNIDDILSSKNDVIRLGNFSITKNEFKIKYSKMCKGIPFVSPSDRLVKNMMTTVRNSDFSTVDPRSVILFAKEIIENYEDIMKKEHIM